MELVLSATDLDPLPERKSVSNVIQPEGILNSNYKQVVKENFKSNSSQSIFGIRQRIKSRRYQFTPGIDVILKVSVFVIALAVIF